MRARLGRKRGFSAKVGRILGERLNRRRLTLGFDLAALEVAIDAKAGALAAVERGRGDLPASQLLRLAEVLDVSVGYFFEDAVVAKGKRKAGIADEEIRSFVTAYWAIGDARARRSVLALACAAAEEGPPA